MTPSPSAAPLPPLPEYVEEAIREYGNACYDYGDATAKGGGDALKARQALNAAIRRYAEEAARGAGVERRVAILTRIVEEQDKLLACFRLGKNPGAIIDRLRKARERLASLAPASTTRSEP